MDFRWIDWNIAKVHSHGVLPEEAEFVASHARWPYPRPMRDGRRIVWGQTGAGRYLQVVYLYDADSTVFVIHARPLNETEKRRLRRSRR